MKNRNNTCNIDKNGYRKNVGIIVCNLQKQVLWARRSNHDGWQFPQGGVKRYETITAAAYRELYEEVGLAKHCVKLLGKTSHWLYYDAPYVTPAVAQTPQKRQFKGQKQIWFLFQLIGSDSDIQLDLSQNPEFDSWDWVHYWHALQNIISFKKNVYKRALTELEPLLNKISE